MALFSRKPKKANGNKKKNGNGKKMSLGKKIGGGASKAISARKKRMQAALKGEF